ncbi:hypothetical protein ACH5RR_022940 [Cinchona calisaya]|uniref:BHLH domain-containing protein n=1 Tax=Cinchona calisaya TaxID=153742 RepID=A0ABD2ZAA2_9GENT
MYRKLNHCSASPHYSILYKQGKTPQHLSRLLLSKGMEDPFMSDQCDIMDFFDGDIFAATLVDHDFQISLSPDEGNSSISVSNNIIPRNSSTTALCASSTTQLEAPPSAGVERVPAAKQLKRSRSNNSPIILTFGNPSSNEVLDPQQVSSLGRGALNNPDQDDAVSEVLTSTHDGSTKSVQATKKGRTRPASQTYDHIIAERKRREQLSQRFMALSAIVPGLKKMDKTSVLGDAITYLKHLQEREKALEEQVTKQTVESVVLVKKSKIFVEDEEGSSDEMGSIDEQRPLPEIEAKLCDKKVLFRVHCENHRGVLVKILSEIEKHNLGVTNISVSPFGSVALDITIIAEMDKEFNLTMKEVVKGLQSALRHVAQDA